MAAEAAGTAATDCVKSLIVDKTKEWYSYVSNYNGNIKDLEKQQKELASNKKVLVDKVDLRKKNYLHKSSEVTDNWLDKVRNIENDRELQELNDIAIRKGKDKCCYGRVRCNLHQRYKMSKTAEAKANEIKLIIDGKPHDSDITVPQSSSQIPSISDPTVDSSRLRSRTKFMEDILDKLRDEKVGAVGIYGMGAVGKTTLVRQIAKKAADVVMFDEIVMAEISEAPNLERIQHQIAEQLDLKLEDRDAGERAKKIHCRLKPEDVKPEDAKPGKGRDACKKILIILDNVWKKLDLLQIGIPQPIENTEKFQC